MTKTFIEPSLLLKKVSSCEAEEAVKTKRKSTVETPCFICLNAMQTFKFINQGEDEVFVCHSCKLTVTKKKSKIEDERIFQDISLKFELENIAQENYKAYNIDDFQQFVKKIKTSELPLGEEFKWSTGDSWMNSSYTYTKIHREKLEELLSIDSYCQKFKCLKCDLFIKVTNYDSNGIYEGSYQGFCKNCNFKISYEDYSY